jgi:hypothetical protein
VVVVEVGRASGGEKVAAPRKGFEPAGYQRILINDTYSSEELEERIQELLLFPLA